MPSVSLAPSTTGAPTATHSQAPTITCVDDENFRVNDVEEQDCNWVRGVDVRRAKQCAKEEVNLACPYACGVCCRDSPTYSFQIDGESQTCATALSYCGLFKNDIMVRKACPATCDQCYDLIPIVP